MEVLKKYKKVTIIVLTALAVCGLFIVLDPHVVQAANEFESKVTSGSADLKSLVRRIAPGLISAVIVCLALFFLGPRRLREAAQDHLMHAIFAVFLICAGGAIVSYLFDLFG
ncbi:MULTISPECIES: hypothetical protein [Listeria]|uniref:hypothetical protein n=1 Tax=Listeria TaxID=1637 RepID=UPI000B58DA50|nr:MULTISPECIES: hypothetical protein [Listeria]